MTPKSPLLARLRAFVRDDAAVAAVEMSLIAPVMLALFGLIVASENSFLAWRKVTNTAHEVTDLVSRSPFVFDSSATGAEDLSKTALDTDLAMSQFTMYPKNTTTLTMVMSEVLLIPLTNTGVVVWSEGYNGGTPIKCGTVVTLDSKYASTGATYLLMGAANYTFQPLGVTLNIPPMTLTSTEILEVRNAQQIILTGYTCP